MYSHLTAVRTNTYFTSAALLLGLVLAACGARGDSSTPRLDAGRDSGRPDGATGTDMGPGHDSGMTGTDSGMMSMMDLGHDSGSTGTDAGMCIATCSINFDCQRTCPMMTGRVECCDTTSHHCFATTGSFMRASKDTMAHEDLCGTASCAEAVRQPSVR